VVGLKQLDRGDSGLNLRAPTAAPAAPAAPEAPEAPEVPAAARGDNGLNLRGSGEASGLADTVSDEVVLSESVRFS
jgi:hypothetical protein